MITISMVQELLADTFFDSSLTVAGLVMYAVTIAIIFMIAKNITAVLLISIPITLIFASMNILTGDLLIVMIVVTVVGVAMAAGRVISGRD